MAVLSRRQVPPWELGARSSYRRWKDRKRGTASNFKHLYASFRAYERTLLALGPTHTQQTLTTAQGSSVVSTIQEKLGPCVADIGIRFQQLAHVPLTNSQNRLCLSVIKSLESIIAYISTDSLFKLLVSYSGLVNSLVYITPVDPATRTFNLKLSSHETCGKLFEELENRLFQVTKENCLCLVEAYIRLCVGYGQDPDTFSTIYKDAIALLTGGRISLTPCELDKLLLIMDRMGLYDKNFAVYYSNRMARSFDLFSENELANFCRYMTRLPFVEHVPSPSHIDLLRSRSFQRSSSDTPSIEGLQYAKRLPRHYSKALLNRRSYEFKPKIDYSSRLSEDEQNRVLRGWDFRNSKFIRTLNRRLPFVLHQYTYFNLIDVAETFYVYGIQTDLLPRFSTELWKYLYTLKYGYPMKSLIVLASLKQGDAATYGRLVRNVPATLCFNWAPELVAEALVACGSLGIKKTSVYNKLAEYLQRRILYFRNPDLVCRMFEALSLARVPQYGIYNQVVTLAEAFPDWLDLKRLVLIAKSSAVLGMLESRLFKLIVWRLDQVASCSVTELIPIVHLSREIKLGPEDSREFYRFIVEFLVALRSDDEVCYEDLVDLLEGMVSVQIRSSEVEELALKVLRSAAEVDVVKILKYFSILGIIESKELILLLGELVQQNLGNLDEIELSGLIWDMVAVGFDFTSEHLLKVVNRFNQLKPRNSNTHLLTVVGSLVRLSEGNNRTWRKFLKIVEGYKDYSWSAGAENKTIIRSVANTIKDSRTFVRQFPFTIDITAMYENIDNTHIAGSGVSREGMEAVGFPPVCQETGSNEDNNVALFYYDKQENPFVLHVKPDGTHEHYFNFYCQSRKRILRSMGWKDTLIFSPNN